MPEKYVQNLFPRVPIIRRQMKVIRFYLIMVVLVVPDILANPGGIIAAFVEMTSDSDDKAQEAIEMTKERVASNVRDMLKTVTALHVRPDQVADYMTYKNILKDEVA